MVQHALLQAVSFYKFCIVSVLVLSVIRLLVFNSIGNGQMTKSSQKSLPIKLNKEKTLVVYSGPTSVSRAGKDLLYLKNFEFFLQHGIDCHATVVITLGAEAVTMFADQITQLNATCQELNPIFVLEREPVCYDMETARKVLQEFPVDDYDFLVYVNCVMTGPSPALKARWTNMLTDPFLAEGTRVLMTGVSINCMDLPGLPHIQSMVYALSRKGLEVARNAAYDCRQSYYFKRRKRVRLKKEIIKRYEVGMSTRILQAGGALQSVVGPWNTTFPNNNSTINSCTLWDPWYGDHLLAYFGSQWPRLEELMFLKSSRVLTPEVAELLNLSFPAPWHNARHSGINYSNFP